MQVVPARALLYLFSMFVSVTTLALAIMLPGRAEANDLQLSAVTVRGADGVVELHVSWRWNPEARRGWRPREQLLAVSFDTRRLVFESEEAALGTGATGELLMRLEAVAGADGARRLFVIPEGQDGRVVVRFRPVYPGTTAEGAQLRICVVSDTGSPALLEEIRISPLTR